MQLLEACILLSYFRTAYISSAEGALKKGAEKISVVAQAEAISDKESLLSGKSFGL